MDELLGNGGGQLMAVLQANDVQHHVERGGTAGAGKAIAVHLEEEGCHLDARKPFLKTVETFPMGGGAITIEQPGPGEKEATRIHRTEVGTRVGEAPQLCTQRAIVITLRLEACYPLHGNDISPETDPISAGLGWTCALAKDFTGVNVLRAIKENGPERRLVAFVMEEKAIPRQGMPIAGGGEVTSGSHSPMLDVGIGMGYVPTAHAKPETELTIDVRGKPRKARVVKKPFYEREG